VFEKRYGLTASQIQHIKTHYQLLLLLDGYDEMPEKINLYLENHWQDWQVKVIITCRLNSLSDGYETHFLPYAT